MDVDLPSFERALETAQPWPTAWTAPPFPPLDLGDVRELREGDRYADFTEALAATAAGARGALDLAIGDGLAAMRLGDRLIRLGFSCLADYAREVLGIQARTAQNLARLSRELRKRPLLRAAVRSGKVRVRKAQTVLPVAVGDAEAEWVELARTLSVRTLEDLVREARASPAEEDEQWTRFRAKLSPQERPVLDEALAVARKVMGQGATRAELLEAMAQEYIGEHPVEAGDEDDTPAKEPFRPRNPFANMEARLEVETQQWACLPTVPDSFVPDAAFEETASAEEIDAELRRLAAMRSSWDDALGHAALAIKASGMWAILGFATYEHYCAERLGLAARAAEQRAALERRLWQVPALREALLSRQLSYEQVRLLSRLPDPDIPAWIPRARELTCIELRRALERNEDAQLRAAGSFASPLPRRIALTLLSAFRAVRAVENPLWDDGRCLVAIARHFLETWKPAVKKRRTRSQRIRERDLGNCQVPMCSRKAAHAHHVRSRAQLGPNDDPNLVGTCPCHHLRGLHQGYIRVSGTAPNGLVWELGGKVWMGPERWREPGRQA